MKTPTATAPSFVSAALPLAISAFLGAGGALFVERVLVSHAPAKAVSHANGSGLVPVRGTVAAPAVRPVAVPAAKTAALGRNDAEAAFRALPDGDPRASAAERTLRTSMPPLLPVGSKLHDIGCRGAECRVSVLHSNPSGPASLMAAVADKLPAGFASLRLYESQGKDTTETVAFMTLREEHEDPDKAALESASTAFAAQASDDAWANRTARAVEQGVKSVLQGGSVLEAVVCRADGCRITIAHSNEADREKFVQAYSDAPPAGLADSRIFSTSDHGVPKTVVFSSRSPVPATDEG